ncbi:MAG: hypothetical protein WBM83_06545 [Flavobacteriaceae bacterium]
MFPYLSYFKFRLSSTNQHGVHSPFVYHYITQCLYNRPKRSSNKTIDVILKSISYFKITNCNRGNLALNMQHEINTKFPKISSDTPPYDLILSDAEHLEQQYFKLKNLVHNDSMLVVDGIYKTNAAQASWNRLKNDAVITVSIDLFYCGVLFFRKEQAKEHFKIRI